MLLTKFSAFRVFFGCLFRIILQMAGTRKKISNGLASLRKESNGEPPSITLKCPMTSSMTFCVYYLDAIDTALHVSRFDSFRNK